MKYYKKIYYLYAGDVQDFVIESMYEFYRNEMIENLLSDRITFYNVVDYNLYRMF